MTKGLLKLEGLAYVFLNNVMSGKTGLSGFANRTVRFCPTEFLSIFSVSCISGLEDKMYYVNLDFKACNNYLNRYFD
jgi:hypothetical protein